MAPRKRRDPIASRRREDDEGEEDADTQIDDDSSIGTIQSDAEHEADVDDDGSDLESSPASTRKTSKRANANGNATTGHGKLPEEDSIKPTDLSTMSADTIAMMKGLDIKDDVAEEEAIQFGEPLQDTAAETERVETVAEKRKREHEEYKKKRDADPAFVPNRGGFFMHDSRNVMNNSPGFRGRGAGRGRGGRAGLPFSPHGNSGMADAPWAHDLHETVTDTQLHQAESAETTGASSQVIPQTSKPATLPTATNAPNRTFSRTVQVGNVNLRVKLPGSKEPTTFSAVPVHSHTRLPHHRPPLRRDKPVRVSIPEHSPRYIFPAVERSFIFIPRAMRPNQQGFGRSRGRGSFTGYGNFSARNSMFGGSIYSPSIAHSRRSSFAREIGRDSMISPVGSVMSVRNRSMLADPSKPVVRLPPALDPAFYGQYPPQQVQYMTNAGPGMQQMVLPQRPVTQNFAGQIPMHQPRPQKQIAVADIESPAALNFPPPQVQQQQPFHHQVPAGLNGQGFVPDTAGSSHSRRTSHPSQHGTPLSQIPERAIHAQSFQPTYQYQQAQAFYPQQYATPMYYYAPGQSMGSSGVAAPSFIPGQQYPYMVPTTTMAPPEGPAQPGTVAHESNGMVYYYDSTQLAGPGHEEPTVYQHMAYVPPQGYVMAPPQGTVYYQS